MSDEDRSEGKKTTNWLSVLNTIAEGGVPQIIAGPAGKAISRLIGGAADIQLLGWSKKPRRLEMIRWQGAP